tara:strand:+ start:619 stop:3255 length:2637 start_codon:yes stop_codon:yes gene_type:complete
MKFISKKKSPILKLKKIRAFIKGCIRASIKPIFALGACNLIFLPIAYINRDQIYNGYKYIKSLELSDLKYYGNDIFSSFNSKNKLDKLELSINYNNLTRLNCLRQNLSDCGGDWAKGTLISNLDKYKIRIRAKGDRGIHRINLKKMSFKVDINGESRYLGMEEFSIQQPIMRNYTSEPLIAKLVRDNKIASPRHNYVRFYLNGEYLGIRHIEESFSKELIEASEKRNGPVFSIDENNRFFRNKYTFYSTRNFVRYELQDFKNWKNSNQNLANDARSVLEVTQLNPTLINKYFDINLWSKYFALMELLPSHHGALPKSVKYYLNPVSGLFEPVFFDGHRVSVWNEGFFNKVDDFLISDFINFNDDDIKAKECPVAVERQTRFKYCWARRWFQSLFGDAENINTNFYENYFYSLKKLTSKEYEINFINKSLDELSPIRGAIYREFHKYDLINNEGFLPHVEQITQFKNRIKLIRSSVENAENNKPYISINNKNILMLNQTSKLPQIINLYCKNKIIDKIILPLGLIYKVNANLYEKCDINELNYSLKQNSEIYKITETQLGNSDFEASLIDSAGIKIINHKRFMQQGEKEELILDGDTLLINKNREIVNKRIILPNTFEICLSKESTLIIKDSIITSQKGVNNLTIKGCDKDSGSIIFQNSKINLDRIKLVNLVSPKLPLRVLYGGLNVIGSEFYFNKLDIIEAKSEDGVNFVDSIVKGDSISAEKISSDAIDSDFSEVQIGNVFCENIGNDCVDFSYSNAKISSIKANEVGDKVVSTGESSKLDLGYISAIKSFIGLASKDSSIINVSEYDYSFVNIPLAAFIKKQEFNSPSIIIKKTFEDIFDYSYVSYDSNVKVLNKKFKGNYTSDEIYKKLYKNLN